MKRFSSKEKRNWRKRNSN